MAHDSPAGGSYSAATSRKISIEQNGNDYLVKFSAPGARPVYHIGSTIELAIQKVLKAEAAKAVANRINQSPQPIDTALKESVAMFGPDAISQALHKSGLGGSTVSENNKREFLKRIATEFSKHLKEVGNGEVESTVFRNWNETQVRQSEAAPSK
jgi:hypothetical protein